MALVPRLLLVKPEYDLLYRRHARSGVGKYVTRMYASKELIQPNAPAGT